jgi:hypothetical protein
MLVLAAHPWNVPPTPELLLAAAIAEHSGIVKEQQQAAGTPDAACGTLPIQMVKLLCTF